MPAPPCWPGQPPALRRPRPGHEDALLAVGHLSPQLLLQLQSLARNGHKTKAARLLRQSTHSDLKTAKNYVDRL